MKTRTAALCLALALVSPLAAQADDNAEKTTVAKAIVDRTILKTLDNGFGQSLEKAVSQMPPEKAEKARKEAKAEFDKQRQILLDGLSKNYADKFSLDELKRVQAIYDDKTYQKFQAVNSDPKSEVNLMSQAAVTKLLNLLSLMAASEQQGGAPGPGGGVPGPAGATGQKPMQMPMPAPAPGR